MVVLQDTIRPLHGLERLREIVFVNLGCLFNKHATLTNREQFRILCKSASEADQTTVRSFCVQSGPVQAVATLCPRVNVVRLQCDHHIEYAGFSWALVRTAGQFVYDKKDVLPLDLFHLSDKFPSRP